ncbi:hypothetical protein [uncultured Algibacter sp.]|uniref:hypothetical protein n=1 Tax=uncultured Algibacter sp. TaxID=298659 RepID=UPI0026176208|nr:hypothetical protein [uncultured Algibacter sp.]
MKNKKLHNINSSGFKVPNDYFESFDEKILSQLNTNSQLDSIKGTGFKVPDNYFESLNNTILNNNIATKETKVIPLFNKRNLVYISSIAAVILLLFNLSLFENKPTFDNLDIDIVEGFIEYEDINTYEIAALFTNEQIVENITIDYTVNDEHIEEYLLNNADLEDLMLE